MTTLPEEVKNAVAKALRESRWLVPAPAVELILTAALPFLSVQGAVKKLEWENSAAQTQFGEYTIVFDEDEEMHETPYCAFSPNDNIGHYENEEAAKAAAQADYEARVMSAIEPVVPVSRPSAARELALDVEFATIRAMIYCYEGDSAQAFEAQKALAKIDAAIRTLSSPDHADAGKVEGDGIERGKFYHHHWPMGKLLEARRDGLVDHSGGEAWRYGYSHKDEHGKYDILYRPVKNTTIPARLPSAPSEGAE
ncbi:hypothetical protein [Brucella intermedia]|uniref:hypothetical protein n=1 Tax=Brucella intermedia TaxID=94625 RepID=UPI0034CD8A10